MNFRVLCHREFPKFENFVLKIVQEFLILEINSSLTFQGHQWLISPNVLAFRQSTWVKNNVPYVENEPIHQSNQPVFPCPIDKTSRTFLIFACINWNNCLYLIKLIWAFKLVLTTKVDFFQIVTKILSLSPVTKMKAFLNGN